MTTTCLYIDGAWRDGSTQCAQPIVNPATEDVVGQLAFASANDVACAIRAAHRAFPLWRDTTAEVRGDILHRAAALLADRIDPASTALTLEQGKPLAESRGELVRAIETLAWHAGAASGVCAPRSVSGGAASVWPEPLGVVGAFTPWNYPAVIIARKLGAALAAGCTVVLKAAEETPTIAAIIVGALEEAGLPPGVVNLVFGDPPAISTQVLDAPEVRAFSFTGSTAVGRQLAARAGRSLQRCVLELGGHAPVLVFADADIDAAVHAIAAYKFECAGQSCNAPSRIYVHESQYDRFVDAFVDRAAGITVGDGRDAATEMGPMAHARRLAAMDRLVSDAWTHGGRIRTGGARVDRRGWFWPPTVLTDVRDEAAILTEEPFGPLAPVWPFSTFDEAIARANATAYGLAGYVFTASTDVADAAALALDVGSVGINELRGVPPDVGISGVKDSGHGYEGGQSGIEAFLNLKVRRGSAERAT